MLGVVIGVVVSAVVFTLFPRDDRAVKELK